ncbi:phosphotyrosyl phosphate activator protein [Ordospora pajunii]|uniref:phosphotyrosyl phosphate activator protein n=1 Tax=Ordospora pajunii TaxID=3039483 RepID=UPI0029527CCE|nr:phosphotyrosyl phosphate activator protein [Ordospora pajunii]KAH9411260.1 phosphotyrosyl phosphate activator protein [Ordospora pajunii]
MSDISFPETDAYSKIYEFILSVDECIKNSTQKTDEAQMQILRDISGVINETEKSQEPHRYANLAAKTVLNTICMKYEDKYLQNSFGNSTRLDYGTGHELNYLCYLYTKYFRNEIEIECIFTTLVKYFEVVREFVKKFNLEPAGSHGVWGLDDYQFLPFLFGSSELANQKLQFNEFNEFNELHRFGRRGCYQEAVANKLGGASQILKSITGKDWAVINRGMIRMYDDHVLRRDVVTQHFIYGACLQQKRYSQETLY